MSIHDLNPLHSPDNEVPNESSKDEVLTWLVPDAILTEINSARLRGYEISIGDSFDSAYDYPDKIEECYDTLHQAGIQFQTETQRYEKGRLAVANAISHYAPSNSARTWAKQLSTSRKAATESLRDRLLYSKLNVQGQPWHKQGGKALALGTIMDAHDLNDSQDEGIYDTMSGRLTEELATHVFGENAGWLNGLSIHEAIIEAEMRFRNKSQDKAENKAHQDIQDLMDFINAPVRPGFKDIVAYSADSLGIRSRKEEVRAEINKHADASDKQEYVMMSVGCGTAIPMLEVAADLKEKGKKVKLILIDQDPIALAAAEQSAMQMGLEDVLEIHCEQLIHGKGRKTRVIDLQKTVLQGRKIDVGEDSGLREYFPNFLYKDLTSQVWNALDDNGLMTTGNMNINRPQPEFLHDLMGWPLRVRMRKISDIAKLHRQAGVPKEASRLRVTQDGVYTMCFSEKQAVA